MQHICYKLLALLISLLLYARLVAHPPDSLHHNPSNGHGMSVSLLVGHARGDHSLAVGGIGHINRGNINGVQASGIFNVISKDLNGVQTSGIVNTVHGCITGVQAAGFSNYATRSNGGGIQVAGFNNLALRGRIPLQVSGFGNSADTATVQVSGFYNYASEARFAQVAGFANIARHSPANIQVSGFLNVSAHGRSATQVAGFTNVADTLRGTQVSGMFNHARVIKGVQIGVINHADSIDGFQIGLLNLSKRGGYVTLELSASEVQPVQFALKTGTPRLYFILTAGMETQQGNAENDESIWSHGAGVGVCIAPDRRLGGTVDLIHRHVNQGDYDDRVQEWVQAVPALNVRITRHIHLAAGPTLNLLVTENSNLRDALVPAQTRFNINNKDNLSGWLGGMAALRIVI